MRPRAPILYWVVVAYLVVTVLLNMSAAWTLFSFYRTFGLDLVLSNLILLGVHLFLKIAAITAFLARKNIAAYLLAAALVAAGVDAAWYAVGTGLHFDLGSMPFYWLPAYAIALLIVIYAFRLKRSGLLRPWRDPGPAAVFD